MRAGSAEMLSIGPCLPAKNDQVPIRDLLIVDVKSNQLASEEGCVCVCGGGMGGGGGGLSVFI